MLVSMKPYPLPTGSIPLGPTNRSFWVVEGRFAGGAYPGKKKPGRALHLDVAQQLLDVGVNLFVNLTQDYPGGTDEHLRRYDDWVKEVAEVQRFPITDVSVPSDPQVMVDILDCIDEGLANEKLVYVHCWGGVGRTGIAVACWLIRHGYAPPEETIALLSRLRSGDKGAGMRPSPEAQDQEEFVASWVLGQ